ncbi:hypothetical protein [Brevundimonas viscosa]|uniref:Uncharacterized protein n=1 Tax=Brevundimonas viscosa TaxID=871741 RepID=A0A1I6THA3_9CAUL|nr:hypothetical protein [Brevundimonas viscosa]SFS88569.1 hypothetical protein SAMN05192570_0059 [Brevundimonas viscosa]
MADGAYRWQGHAPEPDATRVEAIDAAFDEAQVGAFAEPARAAAVDRLERALAAVRTGDLTEAAAQLTHARQTLDALRPEALEPRRGLAGLFDSRGRRLKGFREGFRRGAATISEVAADLVGRIETAARRSGVLDGAWSELRDAVAELDAHLLVAARRLSGQPAVEDAPHPLATRRAALDACRSAALAALPLLRTAQNADARVTERLKACAEGVAAWREDWRDALGLAGRRPRKVRPDRERLLRLRDDLLTRIDLALAELGAARERRNGVERQLAALRNSL